MPSRGQRITNGHRAAVAGLVIAGVPLRDACYIAGAPIGQMHAYLDGFWNRSKAREVTDQEWTLIRSLYEAGGTKVDDIAVQFGIGLKRLYNRAARAGWKLRGAGRKASARSTRALLPSQRRLYRKLRRHGVPYPDAIAEAMR